MVVKKIIGIETEYGIHTNGDLKDNPISASSVIVNSYVNEVLNDKTKWDFDDETPQNDARGYVTKGSVAPVVETHLVNAVLYNGARFYVDHAHPEYSSPEVADALEGVIWDKAGELVLKHSMQIVRENIGHDIVIYKNNSDGKGNSYGCHENYLMDRGLPFPKLVHDLVPFLISRQIYCGAGKVGIEVPSKKDEEVYFQISQRADFFEEVVGLETTLKRPIINTRDEPHASSEIYRRLHVILGDANISETATFLKLGTTAFVLLLIETGNVPKLDRMPLNPVAALHQISHDISLESKIELNDGSHIKAIEIQEEWLLLADNYFHKYGGELLGGDEVAKLILSTWERVLGLLKSDLLSLRYEIDWIAKFNLVDAYREKNQLSSNSPTLKALDLQYHDLRDDKSLASRLKLKTLVTRDQIESAVYNPPESTRAYFRGQCIKKWSKSIVSANWDSIVFDVGEEPLRRVPMMDPLKGNKTIVGNLLSKCHEVTDLLDKLDT